MYNVRIYLSKYLKNYSEFVLRKQRLEHPRERNMNILCCEYMGILLYGPYFCELLHVPLGKLHI